MNNKVYKKQNIRYILGARDVASRAPRTCCYCSLSLACVGCRGLGWPALAVVGLWWPSFAVVGLRWLSWALVWFGSSTVCKL